MSRFQVLFRLLRRNSICNIQVSVLSNLFTITAIYLNYWRISLEVIYIFKWYIQIIQQLITCHWLQTIVIQRNAPFNSWIWWDTRCMIWIQALPFRSCACLVVIFYCLFLNARNNTCMRVNRHSGLYGLCVLSLSNNRTSTIILNRIIWRVFRIYGYGMNLRIRINRSICNVG